jgi:hypothetical protein
MAYGARLRFRCWGARSIARRLLALAVCIWRNRVTGSPIRRPGPNMTTDLSCLASLMLHDREMEG